MQQRIHHNPRGPFSGTTHKSRRAVTPNDVANLIFDQFNREGAGGLEAWFLLSGNKNALDPVVGVIHRLVDEIAEKRGFNIGLTVECPLGCQIGFAFLCRQFHVDGLGHGRHLWMPGA